MLPVVTGHGGSEGVECWAFVLTLAFGTTRTVYFDSLCTVHDEHVNNTKVATSLHNFYSVVLFIGRYSLSHFTPKEIPWYCLLQGEWAPGLLNADRRIRSLQNFEGPHRESSPERPVLWLSAFYKLRRPSPPVLTKH